MQVKHQLLNFKRIKKIKFEVFFIFLLLTLYILSEIFDFSLLRCVFHEITGLHCPGCGVTRMIGSILKLDFYQAFRYNPLVFILSPFLIIYGIIKLYENMYDKIIFNKKIEKVSIITIIILLVIFGILRNIEMFNFLAPTTL